MGAASFHVLTVSCNQTPLAGADNLQHLCSPQPFLQGSGTLFLCPSHANAEADGFCIVCSALREVQALVQARTLPPAVARPAASLFVGVVDTGFILTTYLLTSWTTST